MSSKNTQTNVIITPTGEGKTHVVEGIKNEVNNHILVLKDFVDLAPNITRRRLVIECIHNSNFDEKKIYDYMVELSNVMNMTIVTYPVTNFAEGYGFSAYMSWKESGMHVYTWNQSENAERPNFMSIDIYTCKDFDIDTVINFTKNTFKDNITVITWRE